MRSPQEASDPLAVLQETRRMKKGAEFDSAPFLRTAPGASKTQ